MRSLITILITITMLQACKHPLQVKGEGVIVDWLGSSYGCAWQDQVQLEYLEDPACEMDVTGDYIVLYVALADPGWKFLRWEGACKSNPIPSACELEGAAPTVELWDALFPDTPVAPTIAVFERDVVNWDEFNWDEGNWQ